MLLPVTTRVLGFHASGSRARRTLHLLHAWVSRPPPPCSQSHSHPSEEKSPRRMDKKRCCGSGMFFLDPQFFHPGSKRSRIRIKKNLSISTQQQISKLSELWSGLSSPDPDRIRILIFYPSRIQGSKRYRIPEPALQHWRKVTYVKSRLFTNFFE